MDLKIAYSPTLALRDSLVAIYKIYILKNPFTEEIFYVGQTFQELNTRLAGHIGETGASNRAKKEYIKSIIQQGGKPIIEAVETIKGTCYVDKLFVNEREIFWVKYYKSKGVELLNSALMNNSAECKEFKSYLKYIKEGKSQYKYYYCGTTHGGHEVYDENKMKADGFRLPNSPPPEVKIVEKIIEKVVEKIVWVERPAERIKTTTFPEQPAWTAEFAIQIPANEILEDLEADCSDWQEELSDYEPDCDFEPEEDNDESDFEEECDEEDDECAGALS